MYVLSRGLRGQIDVLTPPILFRSVGQFDRFFELDISEAMCLLDVVNAGQQSPIPLLLSVSAIKGH